MSLLGPQPDGIPDPVPSLFSAPYWDGCAQGELRYLRCSSCHLAIADAARICWRCQNRDLRWEVSAGQGRLYSWTIVWRPQTPAFQIPYAVAIVHLDEDIFVVSSIIGCTPEDLAEGMELAVEFHPINEGMKLPYFRPIADAFGNRSDPSDAPPPS
jgi:uncharacterized OB-fold protein